MSTSRYVFELSIELWFATDIDANCEIGIRTGAAGGFGRCSLEELFCLDGKMEGGYPMEEQATLQCLVILLIGTGGCIVLSLFQEFAPIDNEHGSTDDLQNVIFSDRLFWIILAK